MTDQSPVLTPGTDPTKAARLLDAAAAAFARRGFERAGIDDIAVQAGVGKGTVYLYFKSKAALFQAVLADLHARLAAVPMTVGLQDSAVALRAFIRTQLRLADELPDAFRCYASALFGVNRDFQDAALAIFIWQQEVLDGLLQRATPEQNAAHRSQRAALLAANLLSAALVRGLQARTGTDTAVEERALLEGFLASRRQAGLR